MNFDIDWNELDGVINPSPNKELDFTKVASQFKKVAFDVYEKIGETGLWELKEKEDGTKVLVALYEEDLPKTASLSNWTASPNKSGTTVTLQYSGVPVAKFNGGEYGFASDEAGKFASFIASKASSDKNFIKKLASTMPAPARAHLVNTIKGE